MTGESSSGRASACMPQIDRTPQGELRMKNGFRTAALILASLPFGVSALGQTAGAPASAPAAETPSAKPRAVREPVTPANMKERAVDVKRKAIDFLLAAQAADGGWESDKGVGISCLALTALANAGAPGSKPASVRRGVEFVLKSQHDDGGIYAGEGLLKNYETSVALSMLAAVKDPAYDKQIKAAQEFLKKGQWDEDDGKSIDDPWYGGAGYGFGKRPDLSNLQMMLEALHDSGLPKDDPTYKKALVFISRCQMRAESNDQPFAKGASNGGFIYSTNNGGESKAGEVEIDGRKQLGTYGTMTYAGYKSMLYCGLTKDDPRVKAAHEWIRANWTVDRNPGMPETSAQQGLYYYLHVMSRTLATLGEDVIKDKIGREHNWRVEVIAKLESLQRKDGSFVNESDRWMEGYPALVTAYAVLALEAAEK